MPVQQVGALLKRWQEATGVIGQGRVIADGMRLIAGLTPEERRTLARALGEEGAPELADRLSAASVERVDAATAHDAARGLLQLDREKLAHLADALSDPDERRRLAHDALSAGALATAGAETLPQGTGHEGEDADGPPTPPTSPAPGIPPPPSAQVRLAGMPAPDAQPRRYPTESLHAFANGEVPHEDPDLGDQLLDHPDLGEISLGSTDLYEIRLAPPSGDDDAGATTPGAAAAAAAGAAGAAATTGARADRSARAEPAGDDRDTAERDDPADAASAEAPTAPGPASGASAQAPTAPGPASGASAEAASAAVGVVGASPSLERTAADDDGLVPGAAAAAVDVDALVRDLRSATTAHRRFTCLGERELTTLGLEQALRVLDAIPDGWQRRRVAVRLITSGGLDGVEAGDLLRRFPGAADARFVLGTAVEHGTLTLQELTEHLPEPTLRRLRTRTGT